MSASHRNAPRKHHTLSRTVTTCMVAKQSHAQKCHQFGDPRVLVRERRIGTAAQLGQRFLFVFSRGTSGLYHLDNLVVRYLSWISEVWHPNPGQLISATQNIGILVSVLPGDWCYRVTARSGCPGVRMLWLSEKAKRSCIFCHIGV